MPAVYLALKRFRCFCLSIPRDRLVLIALKMILVEKAGECLSGSSLVALRILIVRDKLDRQLLNVVTH